MKLNINFSVWNCRSAKLSCVSSELGWTPLDLTRLGSKLQVRFSSAPWPFIWRPSLEDQWLSGASYSHGGWQEHEIGSEKTECLLESS